MKDKTKAPEPMDPTTREVAQGTPFTNHARVCGAIKQLVKEAQTLFPETTVEYTERDGRNTALGVVFDLTPLDEDSTRIDAANLFTLLGDKAYGDDKRIDFVAVEKDGSEATVVMRSSLRTQDDPSSFGLADAWSVLTSSSDEGYDEEDDWPVVDLNVLYDPREDPKGAIFTDYRGSL
jgi:hypothetical protein